VTQPSASSFFPRLSPCNHTLIYLLVYLSPRLSMIANVRPPRLIFEGRPASAFLTTSSTFGFGSHYFGDPPPPSSSWGLPSHAFGFVLSLVLCALRVLQPTTLSSKNSAPLTTLALSIPPRRTLFSHPLRSPTVPMSLNFMVSLLRSRHLPPCGSYSFPVQTIY